MKDKDKDIILYLIIGLVLILVIVASFYAINYLSYKKAVSSEQDDICKTPLGYTDESWKEHMGHHPDRYARCLS